MHNLGELNMDIIAMLERIKDELKRQDRPMQELYDCTNVSSSAMSQWRTGATTPKLQSLMEIADFLGMPLSWLMFGMDKKTPAADSDGLNRKLLIDLFERLDESQQAGIIAQLQALVRLREGQDAH